LKNTLKWKKIQLLIIACLTFWRPLHILICFILFFQELTLLPNLEMLDLSGNRLVSHVPTQGMYLCVAAKGIIKVLHPSPSK